MFSRIWLFNGILALFVVFFGLKAYGVWIEGSKGDDIPEIGRKNPLGVTNPPKALYDIKIPPESKYDVLMTLNLFTPERTEIIPETKKQDEKSKKLSAVEQKNIKQYFSSLTLYGLVITDDSAEALVSYSVLASGLKGRKTATPKNRRGNVQRMKVKQTKWVKAGDTLGDFKVVSIKPDRVLLKAGEQSYDLLLNDKEKPKKRVPAKPKTSPNVVGVSVAPKLAKGKGTIPPTDKKGLAIKALSGIAPPPTQKNLKNAIEKKQVR